MTPELPNGDEAGDREEDATAPPIAEAPYSLWVFAAEMFPGHRRWFAEA